MKKTDVETFHPATQQEWRQWLQENHAKKQSVWLIYYKIKSGKRALTWSEAVDEALCFGWIDSIAKPIDDEKYMQFFSQRKPNSTWSKINKEKVQLLIKKGLMAPAGYQCIEVAKQNGSWTLLDDVEELKIPDDLEKKLSTKAGAMDFFLGLSTSVQKMMLHWLVQAKRPETRQKRITEIAENAAQKLRPKQFR